MDEYSRHRRFWRALQPVVCPWIVRRFRLDCEPVPVPAEGGMLLVANHVSAWDPLLIACAMGRRQIYYVASEHILRDNLTGRLLRHFLAPIAKPKGGSSLDTVRKCLAHLKAGHFVCVFAEGEQSWDGRSIPVVRGTGSLVRSSGATLVTYRLEGAYLSAPRWGSGLRRGRVRGRVVGVYPPETAVKQKREEINRLLDRDIRVDAWADQRREAVAYKGKRPAEYLERLLYLCPGCGRVGSLESRGDRLRCGCGLSLRYTETGFFDPPVPHATLADWEDWQRGRLRQREFVRPAEDGALFSDPEAALIRVDDGHETALGSGEVRQYETSLRCAGRDFALREITDMAMTRHDRLLFTHAGGYYQLRVRGRTNLRKYLEIWKEH